MDIMVMNINTINVNVMKTINFIIIEYSLNVIIFKSIANNELIVNQSKHKYLDQKISLYSLISLYIEFISLICLTSFLIIISDFFNSFLNLLLIDLSFDL